MSDLGLYCSLQLEVISTLLELAFKGSLIGAIVLSVGLYAVKQDDEGLVVPFRRGRKRFILATLLFGVLYLLVPSKEYIRRKLQENNVSTVPETLRKSMESAAKQCIQNDSISTNESRLQK